MQTTAKHTIQQVQEFDLHHTILQFIFWIPARDLFQRAIVILLGLLCYAALCGAGHHAMNQLRAVLVLVALGNVKPLCFERRVRVILGLALDLSEDAGPSASDGAALEHTLHHLETLVLSPTTFERRVALHHRFVQRRHGQRRGAGRGHTLDEHPAQLGIYFGDGLLIRSFARDGRRSGRGRR